MRESTIAQHRGKSIPLYVGGKAVYRVRGRVLTKRVRADHLLTKPPAIAFDISILDQAEAMGATLAEVTHEDGRVFRASLAMIQQHGFRRQHPGYGAQVGLPLEFWSVDGRPPEREPVAVLQERRRLAEAERPRQAALFDW